MKFPVTENECDKLENSQLQIENSDYTKNKINIDEMKHLTLLNEIIYATASLIKPSNHNTLTK